MLFAAEKVYEPDQDYPELTGDGHSVIVGGEQRLLSRIPPPLGADMSGWSIPWLQAGIDKIPRSEWSARLAEQVEKQSRVSDFQNFPPHDQDGLPTCWANGPAHAATTQRVIQGLPYVELSSNSIAVPISGGRSGGWEGEALKYAVKHGFASVALWNNNDLNRRLNTDPNVIADRENYKPLEWVDCGNDYDAYVTCALLGMPMAVAYNDWSHVVSLSDAVEIEPGSFGLRIRNNWGAWGAENRFGFKGYAVFREGQRSHGRPSSGFALRQVTSANSGE